MRTTRKSAGELACCNTRSRDHGRHKTARSPRLFSAVAACVLAACSESREPSYDVSEATLAQYENTCGLCHERGDGGAPITGDKEDWQQRVAKGMRKVRENAIVGYEGATGIMPAKGGYMDLTDDEVSAIVDYMVDISL